MGLAPLQDPEPPAPPRRSAAAGRAEQTERFVSLAGDASRIAEKIAGAYTRPAHVMAELGAELVAVGRQILELGLELE
jgi:hypothetical protein